MKEVKTACVIFGMLFSVILFPAERNQIQQLLKDLQNMKQKVAELKATTLPRLKPLSCSSLNKLQEAIESTNRTVFFLNELERREIEPRLLDSLRGTSKMLVDQLTTNIDEVIDLINSET